MTSHVRQTDATSHIFIFTTVETRLYGCSARLEPMEEGKSAVEHLRMIFDLCDRDRDGVITAEDFRLIGQQHFGKTQVSWQRTQPARLCSFFSTWFINVFVLFTGFGLGENRVLRYLGVCLVNIN